MLTKERLRNLRMTCGLTRDAMADLLGYSYQYYCHIERDGGYPLPSNIVPRLRVVLADHAKHIAKSVYVLDESVSCQGGLT